MTREEAIEILKHITTIIPSENVTMDEVDTALEMAISALEQDRPTGQWIEHPKGIYAHLVCSQCLSSAPYNYKTNYCPNCGAKME